MNRLDYHEIRLFGRWRLPPALSRSPFLLASAAATFNFGKNQFNFPQSLDVIGDSVALEKYWGAILLIASIISFGALIMPARFAIWEWLYRVGLWAMFSSWAFSAIILFVTRGDATYVGPILAMFVASAAAIDMLRLDIFPGAVRVDDGGG